MTVHESEIYEWERPVPETQEAVVLKKVTLKMAKGEERKEKREKKQQVINEGRERRAPAGKRIRLGTQTIIKGHPLA